ncbi:nitronate monooxygenase [Actinomycetes bacterium KLBMP 9759]
MTDSLQSPVIAAPLAGGVGTPELVAAVAAAGGLGFLPGGYLTPVALTEQIATVHRLSVRPFGVNLFLPGPRRDEGVAQYRERLEASGFEPGEPVHDDDHYPGKLELLLADPVPIVSFTFGCPDAETVAALHGVGSEVAVTVSSPDEARVATAVGADVLVVQGMEAGAHRGVHSDDPAHPQGGETFGLVALLRLVASVTDRPLIAAGGIMDGAGIAAVLAAGAVAAQLGTAFLRCPEAGTTPAHRAALAAAKAETVITRAFTGRPARGIRNPFLDEHTSAAPAAYPQLHHMTKPIRALGDPDSMSLWAGQAYPLGRPLPVGELVAVLLDEARAAAASTASRLGVGRSALGRPMARQWAG